MHPGEWVDDFMNSLLDTKKLPLNKEMYTGDSKEEIRNGSGTQRWDNKCEYSGAWKDN